jgi:type IV secretory pathway protease TraF
VAGLRAQKKEKILQQVTDDVCKEIDKISPNFVSFNTVPNFIDVRTFEWKNYKVRLRFTYAIGLEKPIEQIWSGFSRGCRQGIKHVSALSPEVEQTHDVSLVLGMWRERRKERGERQNLFSDKYLKELAAAFPHRVTVHSVSIDGRIAGATVCCVLREDRYGYWIGNVNARRDLSTNEFLVWEVIQHAKSKGFKKLDLFGMLDPESLSRFKSKFDPVLEPFCSVDKTDALYKIYSLVYSKLSMPRKTRYASVALFRRRGREANGAR